MNADNTPLLNDGNIRPSIGFPPIDQVDNELDMSNASCNVSCCNPRSISHRLIALVFMCLLGFGKKDCIVDIILVLSLNRSISYFSPQDHISATIILALCKKCSSKI